MPGHSETCPRVVTGRTSERSEEARDAGLSLATTIGAGDHLEDDPSSPKATAGTDSASPEPLPPSRVSMGGFFGHEPSRPWMTWG